MLTTRCKIFTETPPLPIIGFTLGLGIGAIIPSSPSSPSGFDSGDVSGFDLVSPKSSSCSISPSHSGSANRRLTRRKSIIVK